MVPMLLEGLQRLQYRGYDSAGLAVIKDGALEIRRASGKLRNLEEVIRQNPLDGAYGIGTRAGQRTAPRLKRMRTRTGIAMGRSWWCTTVLSRTTRS